MRTRDAAMALGRLGGLARRLALSPARRSELARQAALARWAKRDTPASGSEDETAPSTGPKTRRRKTAT